MATAADGRVRRLALPSLVAGAAAASTVPFLLRDPHVTGSWGSCPVLAVTGIYCPGCGGLRAVNDLAHLRLGDALSSNGWVVLFIAAVGLSWAAWTWGRLRARPVRWDRWITTPVAWSALASLLAFSVLRNTPLLAVLAP